MSEIRHERISNELKNCSKEELMDVLDTLDVEILLSAVWKEIKRLKQLEADVKNIITR